jgi:hypothetical protein
LSGCGLYALGGLFGGGTPLPTSASEPPLRAFKLSGTIQVPENLTAQGALGDIPAMSISKPFETVAGIAELDSRVNYRVNALGNFGILSTGPQQAEMSWTPDGKVRNCLVEIIDPETGEVVGTGRTDANGQFQTVAFARGSNRTAFILQAVLKNARGETAGILAAPVGARVISLETKRKGVDVTAGSTLLAFTSMLMSENFNDLTLTQGFAGLKSVRLARLVSEIDNDEANQASKVLDRGTPVISAPNFDVLLGNIATSSAVLTFEIKKVSQKAAGGTIGTNEQELSFHTAVMKRTLINLVKVSRQDPASASTNLFQAAAEQVDVDEVKQAAESIQNELPPDSVPPLPPAPTPTPGSIGIEFQ